ncbi:type VII secretion protein EccE [Streptomyces sp. NPDC000410]|uniref:type VII secretion protein EccE n=1 Tax=Streptomyces sp. NPDC000410 TaxID=3154254 RepID=UPI0033184C24
MSATGMSVGMETSIQPVGVTTVMRQVSLLGVGGMGLHSKQGCRGQGRRTGYAGKAREVKATRCSVPRTTRARAPRFSSELSGGAVCWAPVNASPGADVPRVWPSAAAALFPAPERHRSMGTQTSAAPAPEPSLSSPPVPVPVPPEPPAPSVLVARRRASRGTLLGARPAQWVLWAAVGLPVWAVLDQSLPGASVIASVAAGLVLLSLIRWRSRWAHQWLRSVVTFRRYGTKPASPAGSGEDAPEDPLAALRHCLVAELEVTSAGSASSRIGVLADGSAWAALIEFEEAGAGLEGIPCDVVATLLDEDGIRLSSVQLLIQSCPAVPPAGRTPTVPESSYAALTGSGAVRTRRCWLVLRLDPGLRQEGAEPWGTQSLHRALRMKTRRAVALLGAQGIRASTLQEQEATAVLLEAAGPECGSQARQNWRNWRTGEAVSTGFWMKAWPRDWQRLHDAFARLPVAATTISLTLADGGQGTLEALCLLRVDVAATSHAGDQRRAVAEGAREAGAVVVVLDGCHRQAVVATLPFGRGTLSEGAWPSRHEVAAAGGIRVPLPAERDGLLLGHDSNGKRVALGLFRPEPGRVAVVGSLVVPHLLAVRALGAGARVHVVTPRGEAWTELEAAAVGHEGALTVTPPAGEAVALGSCASPVLVIADAAALAVGLREPTGRWQAHITVHPDVGSENAAQIAGTDTVIVHRPTEGVAGRLAEALRLGEEQSAWLTKMPQDVVAVVRQGNVAFVNVRVTTIESEILDLTDWRQHMGALPIRTLPLPVT